VNINDALEVTLPVEVTLHIFSHLNEKDLLICSAVSRAFQTLAADPMLWRAIATNKEIPLVLSDARHVKQQVKEYCLRFNRLFRSVFPDLPLLQHQLEQYDALTTYLRAQREGNVVQAAIQLKLNVCIETASLEEIFLLIQAGGRIQETPVHGLFKRIQDYSMRDTPLTTRFRFSAAVAVTEMERQDLQRSLEILEIFMQRGGEIGNTKVVLSLVRIALKYRMYALAKSLLPEHMKNCVENITLNELLTSLLSGATYQESDLPQVKQIIKMLLNAGAQPSEHFAQLLERIGINPQSLRLTRKLNLGTPSARL
jgi:hypothetical protein